MRLSEELQLRLFGQSHTGQVALLLFEGPEEVVRQFAALDGEAVAAGRRDPALLPAGGKLAQILGADLVSESTAAKTPADSGPHVEERTTCCMSGVYFRLQNVFIGDVIEEPDHLRPHLRATIVDGPERLPRNPEAFDSGCVETAVALLGDPKIKSLLYVPVSYDSVVRPSRRSLLTQSISRLPADRKAQIAAIVYGAPRDPPFGAIALLRSTLGDRESGSPSRTSGRPPKDSSARPLLPARSNFRSC